MELCLILKHFIKMIIFENPKYKGNYHYGHRISIKNQNKKPCNKSEKLSDNLVTRFEVGS